MTGISGAEFVAWALPITVIVLVCGIFTLNHYAPQIEEWGRKHIRDKSKGE